MGERGSPLARALELQMADVAHCEAEDWREALSGRRADWVLLDLDRLRSAGVRLPEVLPAARQALAGGGNLCLVCGADGGSLADRLRAERCVRSAVRQVSRAGFREVRRYYAVPTARAPSAFIPARRGATVAFEAMQAAVSSRNDRLRLARLGLDLALYRGHLCLCTV